MKKVFLGGTCNESSWRDDLISMLCIDYFNPVVKDWNYESQEIEIKERSICDFCLYVITSLMMGTYSIAEVIDDSNKRPDKTIFCFLTEDRSSDGSAVEFSAAQLKSLENVGKMVRRNGGIWLGDLYEVSKYLNFTGLNNE